MSGHLKMLISVDFLGKLVELFENMQQHYCENLKFKTFTKVMSRNDQIFGAI